MLEKTYALLMDHDIRLKSTVLRDGYGLERTVITDSWMRGINRENFSSYVHSEAEALVWAMKCLLQHIFTKILGPAARIVF